MKIRTIITQDAEVDDQNSLRHFLFYTNEVELQGIVQTSSKFHWQGLKGAKPIEGKDYGTKGTSFEEPYRWTGTDWMMDEIDAYAKDYPNLLQHDSTYPSPNYLRSIIKIGNVGCVSDMSYASDGSNLIKDRILDEDDRPLYIQVWGGTNTIARALYDIEQEYQDTPNWKVLHDSISKKVILTACGQQDTTYMDYIAESWPDIQFVTCLQMKSYSYPWFMMPECESKDSLKAKFMKEEIMNGKSALADGYCTWLDGNVYEGEALKDQFGSNPNVTNEWFGAKMLGLTGAKQYDFLSEGDSPTFFCLLDWGFRTLENFGYGGFSGRYHRVYDQVNSKGETLNMWMVDEDEFTSFDGKKQLVESMWPYVCDIQRDFASRVDWASKPNYMDGEHKPSLSIEEGLDLCAKPNDTIMLHAHVSTNDKTSAHVTYRFYSEASTCKDVVIKQDGLSVSVLIPESAKAGDTIHVVVQAKGDGHYGLVKYQQIIITIE